MKRPSSSLSCSLKPRPFCPDFMWLDSSTTREQVLDQLETMRRLEQTSYARRDYLHGSNSPYNNHYNCNCNLNDGQPTAETTATTSTDALLMDVLYVLGPMTTDNTTPDSPTRTTCTAYHGKTNSPTTACSGINERTRQCVVDLLYQIADYCHFRRETVAYAVWNIMDRYLSSLVGVVDDVPPTSTRTATTTSLLFVPQSYSDLQLVAFSSLYIAVKLLEPVSMDVVSLADLSKGVFGPKQVLEMEHQILRALKWNVAHGPTPIAFVQHYLTLLHMDGLGRRNDMNDDEEDWEDWEVVDALLEQAQYQVELAISQYSLVAKRHPSDVALAAVWNALESQLLLDDGGDDDGEEAIYWEHRLLEQHLAHVAGFDTCVAGQHYQQRNYLAKIQLKLSKLQFNAQPPLLMVSPQQQPARLSQQQQHPSSGPSRVVQTDNPVTTDDKEDHDEEEESERTSHDDDNNHHNSQQQESVALHPSPTTVLTRHLSADYSSSNSSSDDKTAAAAAPPAKVVTSTSCCTTVAANTTSSSTAAYDSYHDLSFLNWLLFY